MLLTWRLGNFSTTVLPKRIWVEYGGSKFFSLKTTLDWIFRSCSLSFWPSRVYKSIDSCEIRLLSATYRLNTGDLNCLECGGDPKGDMTPGDSENFGLRISQGET